VNKYDWDGQRKQTGVTMTESIHVHKALAGLPASLLAQEGKTIAVIALMQHQAGLNR